MCRSIKTLFNVQPGATEEEIRGACVQFVRKISGYRKPSRENERVFGLAVDEIARASGKLITNLRTSSKVRGRGPSPRGL